MDLNVDLGEGCPWDEPLFALATSASICCGRHSGGEVVAMKALEMAKRQGVSVGAHPGYDDREHFGRSPLTLSSQEVATLVCEQINDLIAWGERVGVRIRFVKPHGALYNQAQREPTVASGVIQGVRMHNLPIVGLPTGILGRMVRDAGLRYIPEGFVDRRYDSSGQLVSRSQSNAMLTDPTEIERQMEWLVDRGEVETLCVHGDQEQAVSLATRVREVLSRLGVQLRSFD
jgi:UPF0271 protein